MRNVERETSRDGRNHNFSTERIVGRMPVFRPGEPRPVELARDFEIHASRSLPEDRFSRTLQRRGSPLFVVAGILLEHLLEVGVLPARRLQVERLILDANPQVVQ